MKEQTIDSSLLDKAIIFAVKAHKNTERRSKGFPYVVHPLEAVSIVATITNDQELLAATALHDVIEDTEYTYEDIKKEFGEKVADLVKSESEPPVVGVPEEESWKDRKQAAIDRIKNSSYESKIVAIGDKLSNMRTIARDYFLIGDKLWERFHNKEASAHAWHYKGLADALSDLKGTFAYDEFLYLVERIFG